MPLKRLRERGKGKTRMEMRGRNWLRGFRTEKPPKNKPITKEEAEEFFRMVKHNEYSIMDQLKKALAKISLSSLIMSSKPHRKAFMNMLNESSVI